MMEIWEQKMDTNSLGSQALKRRLPNSARVGPLPHFSSAPLDGIFGTLGGGERHHPSWVAPSTFCRCLISAQTEIRYSYEPSKSYGALLSVAPFNDFGVLVEMCQCLENNLMNIAVQTSGFLQIGSHRIQSNCLANA